MFDRLINMSMPFEQFVRTFFKHMRLNAQHKPFQKKKQNSHKTNSLLSRHGPTQTVE